MLHRPQFELEPCIIGVTTGPVVDINHPDGRWKYGQAHPYVDAIENAGGSAVLLPFMRDPGSDRSRAAFKARCLRMSGFMLAGGNDMSSSFSNEEHRITTEQACREQDISDLFLVELADKNRIPILGICRGMQALNVARGGTLYQHLPTDIKGSIHHRHPDRDPTHRHSITVERASRLGRLLPAGEVMVNSNHHQAINSVGSDLRVVARAEDGVIEAIESTDPTWFALGVQWHPELLDFGMLIEALVEASQKSDAPKLEAA